MGVIVREKKKGYVSIINTHLLPAWGDVQLDKITASAIKKYLYGLVSEGRMSGTARNVKNCLSAIFRHTITQDHILELNPAAGIVIPKPEAEESSRQPCPFSTAECDVFEAAMGEKFPHYYPLVVCGFRTGLRIGELMGLQRSDIDFFNGVMCATTSLAIGKQRLKAPRVPAVSG